MLEAIIDTNVIISGIFQQLENEDCWGIIKLLRTGKIRPVVSKSLLREYQFIPSRIALEQVEKLNAAKTRILIGDLFQYYSDISELMFNAKLINVTSKKTECLDPEDDKIYNLAVDANCTLIITKNISDFRPLIDNPAKTKTGKDICIYLPNQFLTNYAVIEWSENRRLINKK